LYFCFLLFASKNIANVVIYCIKCHRLLPSARKGRKTSVGVAWDF
jgi:hypothetical protein